MPNVIVSGSDGNLWFTDGGATRAIGKVNPSTGAITEYSTGLNNSNLPDFIVDGPDGNLWFTDNGSTPAIGKITTTGVITEYTTGGGSLYNIVVGPDGNLWSSVYSTSTIYKVNSATGAVAAYTTDVISYYYPTFFIVAGPDGNLWFTDSYTPAIGKVYDVLPAVTAVSPASGPTTGGTQVTINGSGFTGATAVNFGSTAGTGMTVNSATEITVTSPAETAGMVDVTVTTPGGTSATNVNDRFTYLTPTSISAPTIIPNGGTFNGPVSVQIQNSDVSGAVYYNLSNVMPTVSGSVYYQAPFTVSASTTVTAAVYDQDSGVWSNPVTADFTIDYLVPTITSISPTSGQAAGGTSVTVSGTGFTGATAVKFGTTDATSYTVNSSTIITATSPAGSGTVDVTVTTPGGTSATGSGDQFTYMFPPITTGTISGTVMDGGNNPISGATVSLTVSGSVYSATTIANGSYSITNVPAGAGYTVTAGKSGYNSGSAANVSVTANTTTSGVNIILTVIPPAAHTVSVFANPSAGGTVSGGGTYTEGTAATVTATPNNSYTFVNWTEGGIQVSSTASYTFAVGTADRTLTANFSSTSSGGGGSGGSSSGSRTAPAVTASVEASGFSTSVPVAIDSTLGSARASVDESTVASAFNKANADTAGIRKITVQMPEVQGVQSYSLELPADLLSSQAADRAVEIKTGIATMTVPGNMLAANAAGAQNVLLTIAAGDKSKLASDVQSQIGSRPFIELNLKIDGKTTSWSNVSTPVAVSIPYTPTAEELQDPEHIVIRYIDGVSNVIFVPDGRYDTKTGMVTFTATHFSGYAVAYVFKTYNDLRNYTWAQNPIEVMASKGIISGTSATAYSPAANITRADYLVLLVRTLGLTAKFDTNFHDVERGAYYYEAVGIAKKLGLAIGVDSNKFNPQENISRQDMLVLTARALEKFKHLEPAEAGTVLDKFNDKADIAGYAVESLANLAREGLVAGSGDKLNPRAKTTRAEAAVFLYRIYNKY